MKKQYKAPLTEVVKINAEQLICLSIGQQGNYDPGTMTIGSKDDEDYGNDW